MAKPSAVLEPRLLTRHEVANLLRVSRATVDRMIQDGRLRSIKVGRMRRIPLSSVDEWLERVQDEQWGPRATPTPGTRRVSGGGARSAARP